MGSGITKRLGSEDVSWTLPHQTSKPYGHWCHYHVQLISSLSCYVGISDCKTLQSTKVTGSTEKTFPPRLSKTYHMAQIYEGRIAHTLTP